MITPYDLYVKIKTINPNYITNLISQGTLLGISDIYYAPRGQRIYFIIGEIYLFYTDDDFETIHDVPEVNTYFDTTPIITGRQGIKYMVETMDDTMIVVGKDWKKASPASTTDWATVEHNVVYRKTAGSSTFTRVELTGTLWTTTVSSKIDAGYLGAGLTKIIAFTNYTKSLYFSTDDGLTWATQDMSAYVLSHIHTLCITKVNNPNNKMWLTFGDDYTGAKGGIYYIDSITGSTLAVPVQAFAERQGYRLVPIACNTKMIVAGNESGCGGLLAISNDTISITNKAWEYLNGRNNLDYHNFRALMITPDNLIVSGTYGYDGTPQQTSGGYIHITDDEGVTYQRIAINHGTSITNMTCSKDNIWAIGSIHYPNKNPLVVFRIAKPVQIPVNPYIVKPVYLDNGKGAMPKLTLAAGASTPMANMSKCKTLTVSVETWGAGDVLIQATPFKTDPAFGGATQADIPGWYTVASMSFRGAEQKRMLLSEQDSHNMMYRIVNKSKTDSILIKHAMFIGRN